MKRRRSKKMVTPLMLFWSLKEQRRFVDAVEKLVSHVNDVEARKAKRKAAAKFKAVLNAERQGEEVPL